MTSEQEATVLAAVQTASRKWQAAFNRGDGAGCAAAYEEGAAMTAKPFGSFTGRSEIQAFWDKIIADGFAEVDYIEPEIAVVDEASAILSSKWRMNKAHGVITKELWVMQDNGQALLREDEFEVLG